MDNRILRGPVRTFFETPSPTRDTMNDADFNAMMEKGYSQAVAGEGMELDAAFDDLRKGIEHGVQS